MNWLDMFAILAFSGVVIYLLTKETHLRGGILYMVGHIIGTLLGLVVRLYISVCILLVVLAFILSPFLLFSYVIG